MKSICQALILSAVHAIEAETEVNATYGMKIASHIPSPNVDAIVFPKFSAGGETPNATVTKLIAGLDSRNWSPWSGMSWRWS